VRGTHAQSWCRRGRRPVGQFFAEVNTAWSCRLFVSFLKRDATLSSEKISQFTMTRSVQSSSHGFGVPQNRDGFDRYQTRNLVHEIELVILIALAPVISAMMLGGSCAGNAFEEFMNISVVLERSGPRHRFRGASGSDRRCCALHEGGSQAKAPKRKTTLTVTRSRHGSISPWAHYGGRVWNT
jgi:hypothetical protein